MAWSDQYQFWYYRHNDIHLQARSVQTLLVSFFSLKDHVTLISIFVLISACCWASAIKLWIVILLNLMNAGISIVVLILEISRPRWYCYCICTCQR
jgi:hypothetical protein